ncbi:MAG TPA: hypothetical protein VL307_06965 [Chitinophagaceae bacterium]|nr:hypothetical protein [Chitinophagaceae bacterium]
MAAIIIHNNKFYSMQQNPSKEKIVNAQPDQATNKANPQQESKKPEPADKAKEGLSDVNLKGKKVDGDPSQPADQPVDILNK